MKELIKIILSFTLLFCFVSCSARKGLERDPSNKGLSTQIFISHPTDKNKKVEFFIDRPAIKKPVKTIILVHGHQDRDKVGGYDFVRWGVLEKWKNFFC